VAARDVVAKERCEYVVDEPLDIGGSRVRVDVDDEIVGDEDGVVVLPPAGIGRTADAREGRLMAGTAGRERQLPGIKIRDNGLRA